MQPSSAVPCPNMQPLESLLGGACAFDDARARFEARDLVVRESQRHPDLYTVSYRDVRSDFSDPVARLARGLVLCKGTNEVVCFPFVKFFNAGEKHADNDLCWGEGSCTVTDKVDGSLMKVYRWRDEWIVATNRTIDARDAPVRRRDGIVSTFAELFGEAVLATTGLPTLPYADMNPRCTYVFELVHPAVSTVVVHRAPHLTHIGTRLIGTVDSRHPELDVYRCGCEGGGIVTGVSPPERYPHLAASLQHVREAAQLLTSAVVAEGFVVCDSTFRRVKVKSPAYVAAHATTTLHGGYSDDTLLGAVASGNAEDLIAALQVLEARVRVVQAAFQRFLGVWQQTLARLHRWCDPRNACASTHRRAWATEANRIKGETRGVPFWLTMPFEGTDPCESVDVLTRWVADRRTHLSAKLCLTLTDYIMAMAT